MVLTFARGGWVDRVFPWFKALVYTLLAINAFLFLTSEDQTVTEAIDSLAWLTLLFLLEWETRALGQRVPSRAERWIVHGLRSAAFLIIAWAAWSYSQPEYINEYGRLDQFNSILWLGVVLAIEYDVRVPGLFSRLEWALRNGIKIALYAGLIVIAALWGFSDEAGALLDFYDAALWILCFFAIELNILRFEDEQPYAEEQTDTA
ncbi:MAG: hypothetical protein ACK4IT_10435 [Thioalkalivibrionaceae bacterium]